MDSEIWPNFILKIKKKNIPLILLNARITKKVLIDGRCLEKYQNFSCFTCCILQAKETSQYLNNLGAQNIKFYGNIKFCSSIEEQTNIKINLKR